MNISLPEQYFIRPATKSDLQSVADLIIAADIADSGSSEFTAQLLQTEWRKPDFNIQDDAWVVIAPGAGNTERIVAYGEVWNRDEYATFNADGYVHPDYYEQGLGTVLLQQMEARARAQIHLAPEGQRVVLHNGISGKNQAAREIHERRGYQIVRYFWRMETEISAPPAAPAWPAGITLRGFQPGVDDRAVFNAFHEAFRDHWVYTEWDYDYWQESWSADNFDPSLWYLAMEGETITGGGLCTYRKDVGWVRSLAVRRPWRRKGLGLALLQHALGEFYSRGTYVMGLGVDAQSPTGATRLYEKAGMQVAHEYVVYEMELRPGTQE